MSDPGVVVDPLVRMAPSIQRQIDDGKARLAAAQEAVKANGVPPLDLPKGPIAINPASDKPNDAEEIHQETDDQSVAEEGKGPSAKIEYTREQALEALAHSNQRLQTLQGKYSAEVPAQAKMIADLKRDLDSVRDELRRVSVVQEPANKPLTPAEKKNRISEDERTTYGEDFFNVVGRRAQEVAEEIYLPQIQELQNKVKELDGSVTTIGPDLQKAKLARFEAFMDGSLTGWRETDTSPLFLAWLNENDPLSARPRADFFQDAYNKEDFNRALRIYTGYLSERGITAPPPPKRPGSNGQDTSKRLSLDTVAAPNARQRSGSVPLDQQAPQEITPAQVKNYYRDKGRGLYVGRDAEVAEIEAAIARLANRSATGQQPG